MKILLLNENPVVSKLINLSAQKMSYEIEESDAYNDGIYDVIIVDSDTEVDIEALREKCKRLIYLNPRNKECDVKAEILQKPFLPTDFLALLSKEAVNYEEAEVEDVNPYANLSIDLDSLNLEDLPNEEESETKESEEIGLDDLSLDEDVKDEQEVKNEEEFEDLSLEENLDEEPLSLDENLKEPEELVENKEEAEQKELSLEEDLNEPSVEENLSKNEELGEENLEEISKTNIEDLPQNEPLEEAENEEQVPEAEEEQDAETLPVVEDKISEVFFKDNKKNEDIEENNDKVTTNVINIIRQN